MKQFLIGREDIMMELVTNVFAPLAEAGADTYFETAMSTMDDGSNKVLLSYDHDVMTDDQIRAVEALLYIRHSDGLMEGVFVDDTMQKTYVPLDSSSAILEGAFELTASSEKEMNELYNDIFKASDIYDVHVSRKPVAPGMLSFTCFSMLAVGLTVEEINKLDKCTSTKKLGKKARKFLDTLSTRTYASASIISKDIIEPGAEVVAKLGGLATATAVNATFKAGATFADEVLKNCDKQEFANYEPYQRAKQGFKNLFMRSNNSNASGSIRSRKI